MVKEKRNQKRKQLGKAARPIGRNCVICQSPVPAKIIYKDNFSCLVKCQKCGMIFDNKAKYQESLLEDPYFFDGDGHYNMKVNKMREKLRRPLKEEVFKNIIETVSSVKGKKFLDIGCSTGDLITIASKSGFETYGLDISNNACSIARKNNLKSKIFTGDLFEAKYPSGFFDVINISNLIYHLENPLNFMAEVYRVLKPKGIVSVEESCNSHFKLLHYFYFFFTGQKRYYKYALNFFEVESFKKFISKTQFKFVGNFFFRYSDMAIIDYIDNDHKSKLIKVLFKINRFVKIDKRLGLIRVFQSILTK